MTVGWICPKCQRGFTRTNQRHACGTGDSATVVRSRPPEVVATYGALEKLVKSLGEVEVVARERYVLFRSKRIFADAVIMSDAVRLALHLARKAAHPLFFKVAADPRHVTHVAKLHGVAQLAQMEPFLREAYEFSLR